MLLPSRINLADIMVFPAIFSDVLGLASRLFDRGVPDGLNQVINFILTNEQSWHEIGCTDKKMQPKELAHLPILYTDETHTARNPDISYSHCLQVLKIYMEKLASKEKQGSDEANWYSMNDKLADRIETWTRL